MTAKPEMTTSDTDLRKLGYATMRSVVRGRDPNSHPIDINEIEVPDLRDGKIGEDLVDIGVISVWAALWSRDGLARRDRSLVTLGVLIALGAEEELVQHVRFALGNGLTRDELAEVIYHAAGYAGFPRAVTARRAAREALGES